MKTKPHIPQASTPRVKLAWRLMTGLLVIGIGAACLPLSAPAEEAIAKESIAEASVSDPAARELLSRIIANMVNGAAFDAKVRETVYVSGRDIVGVGTYEQAGGGTGHYHLQLTMHDGDGKHTLRQICDGRLAWTRHEIAGEVILQRIDVGRLDEWIPAEQRVLGLPPHVLVGGWAELLATLDRDYSLTLGSATLKEERVLVITGKLHPTVRARVLKDSHRSEWPELYPTQIQIAIATTPNPQTGFGQWLPLRMEFRGDPIPIPAKEGYTLSKNGPLITLIELYSLRQIDPPPAERFRFENQNSEIDIINQTDRYMESYGVRLTAKERRSLRR